MKKLFPNNNKPCGMCKFVGNGFLPRRVHKDHTEAVAADFYKCTEWIVCCTDETSDGENVLIRDAYKHDPLIKSFIKVVLTNNSMSKDELDSFLEPIERHNT